MPREAPAWTHRMAGGGRASHSGLENLGCFIFLFEVLHPQRIRLESSSSSDCMFHKGWPQVQNNRATPCWGRSSASPPRPRLPEGRRRGPTAKSGTRRSRRVNPEHGSTCLHLKHGEYGRSFVVTYEDMLLCGIFRTNTG